jgi:hypothetical protein
MFLRQLLMRNLLRNQQFLILKRISLEPRKLCKMRDLSLLSITNLDLPKTTFNEEALVKPAVYDSEEEKFITQKAQQDERFVRTLHNQP